MTPSASTNRAPSDARAQSSTPSQASFWRSTSRFGRLGAVAEKVGGGEAQDVLKNRLRIGGDAVDGRVDQPRDRHGHRVDVFLLGGEFVGDQFRRRSRGQGEKRLGGGAHRLAVELDGKAFLYRSDRDLLVEALGQLPLELALRPAHRVGIGQEDRGLRDRSKGRA